MTRVVSLSSSARRTRRVRVGMTVAMLLGVVPVLALVETPGARAAASALVDINPDTSDNPSANATTGGRGNGVANVPGEPDTYYSASEFGGIFKTVDGAGTWFQLDDHLPMATRDVAVDPGNTGTVYATSLYDGRANNSVSGINVSYDGGATWAHPATATPGPGASCNATAVAEPAAFGIAIQPGAPQNVFIGTNCGLAVSTNSGATWTFLDPTPATSDGNIVWDVAVQADGTLDICGDDGHFRRAAGAATFVAGDLPAGRCTLTVSPDENYVLLATNGLQAYETDNAGNAAGANWVSLGQIDSSTQSREAFVKVNDRTGTAFDVWVGNVSLYRAGCTTPAAPAPGGANRCGGPGTWAGPFTRTVGAHDDVGAIVFNVTQNVDACPVVFSSDGGMHVNTDTGADCHNPNWAKANVGYHAEWLWTMAADDQAGVTPERLTYGMQDDGLVLTQNAGATPPTWTQPGGIDVFDAVIDDDRLLFTQCCFSGRSTALQVANPDGTGVAGVTNYPNANEIVRFKFTEPLAQFGNDRYALLMANGVTGTGADAADSSGGLFVTTDFTQNPIQWAELGQTPQFACGIQVSRPASIPGGAPTFFVQVGFQGGGFNPGGCNTINGDQVWKYSGLSTTGTWTRIDNNAGAGGFTLFAVDPSNPNRLYAARNNAGTPQMVFSTNGGTTWTPDPELDSMMTGGGDFVYAPGTQNLQPTLLGYDPADPNVIVAGGHDSGVFISTNAGQDWSILTDPRTPHLSGTPHLPQPRYAYFDHEPGEPTRIFVGTRGRGVWRLTPASADLRITKTASPSPATAGEQLFYTVTVTNDGPNDAPDVTVTDNLPDQVTYVTDTDTCTENPSGSGDLECDLGDIPAGESRSFVIKVAVDPDVVSDAGEPTTITNTASVGSGGATDPDPSDNEATVVTIVEDEADLAVTKLCKPDTQIQAGETIECTVFVDNYGPSYARDVFVTDTILSDQQVTVSNLPPSCTRTAVTGGWRLRCQFGDVANASSTMTGRASVTYSLSTDEGGDIDTHATAASDTPDPNPDNNEAHVTLTVDSTSDLRIDKSGPATAVAGTDIAYSLSITNDGPSIAHGVVIEDNVPAGVAILAVSGSNGATCNAGAPGDASLPTRCSFGDVAPDASRTMTISVHVLPDTLATVHNDARVTSDTFDPDLSDNLDTVPTVVSGVADLSITKTDSPDPVVAGDQLTYTIEVTNNGPSTAQDVVITDTLPAGTTFVSGVDGNGATVCALVQPGTVVCDLGTMPPGTSETVLLTVLVDPSVPDGSVLTNSAEVSSSTADSDPSDNTATSDTAVTTAAELWLDKTAEERSGNPSPVVVYTLTVHNNAGCEADAQSSPTPTCGDGGPSDAQDIVVVDQLPLDAKKMTVQFISPQCVYDAPTHSVTCTADTVPAGATVQFVIEVQIKGSVGTITNSATLSSSIFDPVNGNNFDSADIVHQGGTGKGKGGK